MPQPMLAANTPCLTPETCCFSPALLCLTLRVFVDVACVQLLPYRPEPWAKLARLYRVEKRDYDRCFSYAAAGLAQGPAKTDGLFVDRWVSGFAVCMAIEQSLLW